MPTANDRYVVRHPNGWAVKKGGSKRASVVHSTQFKAISKAKAIVENLGGGEVRIQRTNGEFRNSDTVPKGNDPFPPRDKK